MTRFDWGTTWPTAAEFSDLARERRVIPVVRRILADDLTPVGIYRRLAGSQPGTFILESAEADGAWHRWSFVGVRAQATLLADGEDVRWLGDPPVSVPASGTPLEILRGTLAALHTEPLPGLPPLTGGLVGALGWDACWYFHPDLTKVAPEELHLPDLALMLVADMVAIDHHDGSAWLIANAINTNDTETGVEEAYEDAVRRLDALASALTEPSPAVVSTHRPVTVARTMRTSQGEYEESVREVKREIARGACEQVVLSGRLDLECEADPLDVYRALRTINPSPYMYLLHLPGGPAGDFHVVGSSPETLIKVSAGTVTTFPIAGSRPRGRTPAEDRALEQEMLADEKEVSEHVMLVDLAKADLGQTCTPDSIDVEGYMRVQRFSHIMHITSTVTGALQEGKTALDALAHAFPAGTLSGSPRRKAIEVIDALEPARRGIYGGTVGYFDFAGEMDMAIAIRTAVISGAVASVQAGAGLVAGSDPRTEYLETRSKAEAAVRAVEVAAGLQPLTGGGDG